MKERAKPEVPMLLGYRGDADYAVRRAITNALRVIDPEGLTCD